MKNILYILLVVCLFTSCSSDGRDSDEISSIKINEITTTINVGETYRFSVSQSPAHIIPPRLEWVSSDTKIAKIDTTGLLEALSDGEITIKASAKLYPHIKDEVSVKILPLKATSISIDSIASVYYDGSKCFSVKYYPEKAKKEEIIWTSSNENVATVSKSGCVQIKGVGNATITATILDSKISSMCRISINHRNPNKKSVQCIAKTQSGSRCKRMTTNLNARCWQH